MNAKGSDTGMDTKGSSSFWTLKRRKDENSDHVEHPPFEATLPRVNLVPDSVRDGIKASKIVRRFVLGGLVVVAATAGIWFLQSSQINDASARLESAQAENMAMKAKVNGLAPVKSMYTQITGLQTVVTTTLASQPQAAQVVTHLQDAAAKVGSEGGAIFISNVAVNYTGIPKAGDASSCPNPDPFGTSVSIGCLTFSAKAGNRDDVSAFLRALDADPVFIGPYVAGTTLDGSGSQKITFSGSAAVSLDALDVPLTDEQLKAITTPPSASASPSPEAQ